MKQVTIKKALQVRYPQSLVNVVSIDSDHKPNAMPAGWYMRTSSSPPLMAISVAFERYTHQLIEASKEFVLSFPSQENRESLLYCGTHSGKNVDKFEHTELTTTPSAELRTPLIDNSVACLECQLADGWDTGDHTIFVGEVVAAHKSREKNEKLYNKGGYWDQGANAFKTLRELHSDS